ncbi:MAG: hypothetical protein D6737_16360, partial [Chloroflexi bacterium]
MWHNERIDVAASDGSCSDAWNITHELLRSSVGERKQNDFQFRRFAPTCRVVANLNMLDGEWIMMRHLKLGFVLTAALLLMA